MNIAVIGTGYVGIISAVVFADFGNHVWGLDIDEKKVANLKNGVPPIYEPRLEEFLQRGLQTGRLHFTSLYQEALANVDTVFICVGTPQSETGEVDLTYVKESIKDIAQHMTKPLTIVLKSTVPPGIHFELEKIISKYSKYEFEFASCPEFLKEGSAIDDTLHPDRIVIGVNSKKAEDILLNIHKNLSGERVVTDVVSAQMIKYAANSLLATKISFANAIARICDLMGADVTDVMKGVGLDRRIGSSFISAGLGFGGSCFPKDIKGLYYLSKNVGYDFKLLYEVDQINQTQVDYLMQKVTGKYGDFANKKVAILGLAFKPDTDDMRDSRSVVLINFLLKQNAQISVYDPIAINVARTLLQDKVNYCKDAYDAVESVDAVFLVTEWNEFKQLDMKKIKELMRGKLLIDGRNMYNPLEIKALGFDYVGVGRE